MDYTIIHRILLGVVLPARSFAGNIFKHILIENIENVYMSS